MGAAGACGLEGGGATINELVTDSGAEDRAVHTSDSGDNVEEDAGLDSDVPESGEAGDTDSGPAPDGSCGARFTCLTNLAATCVDDCSGCDLLGVAKRVFACPTTHACVANCQDCADAPLECFECATVNSPKGTCQATNSTCSRGEYTHCACDRTTGSSGCPGASQVCDLGGGTGQCRACGENGSNDLACKQAGKCDKDKHLCR
jgi:hypothetical protein